MALQPIKVPKSIKEFQSKGSDADLQHIEDLLNALQNLKVQVTVAGTTRVVSANIQFAGGAAVLVIDL